MPVASFFTKLCKNRELIGYRSVIKSKVSDTSVSAKFSPVIRQNIMSSGASCNIGKCSKLRNSRQNVSTRHRLLLTLNFDFRLRHFLMLHSVPGNMSAITISQYEADTCSAWKRTKLNKTNEIKAQRIKSSKSPLHGTISWKIILKNKLKLNYLN